jgi:hypothetical protein
MSPSLKIVSFGQAECLRNAAFKFTFSRVPQGVPQKSLDVIFNANENKNWHYFRSTYGARSDFCFFEPAGFLAGLGSCPGIIANAQA